MSINRIVPNIKSVKLEESKMFYTDLLGLKLVMDMDWVLTFSSESNPLAQINVLVSEDKEVSNSDTFITVR